MTNTTAQSNFPVPTFIAWEKFSDNMINRNTGQIIRVIIVTVTPSTYIAAGKLGQRYHFNRRTWEILPVRKEG